MEIQRSPRVRCARIRTYLARFLSLVSPLVWLGLRWLLLNFLRPDKLFSIFFERLNRLFVASAITEWPGTVPSSFQKFNSAPISAPLAPLFHNRLLLFNRSGVMKRNGK